MNDIEIRPAHEADFASMWSIFSAHVATGETYTFTEATTREAAHGYWLGADVRCCVAVSSGGRVLGMYRLAPNQAGRGQHVANASFMVSPSAQGVGIGQMLGRHCIEQARGHGYLAMQFNHVVSTNTSAIRLWKKLGFAITGTLPKAFRHKRLGYVDAYVMYQLLQDPDLWPTADE